MEVMVNATTLVKGGGVQVATSFIVEAEKAAASDIVWHYAVSREIVSELTALGVSPERVHLFDASPARSKQARQQLLELEQTLSPDVVFSVFGPAFVKFKSPHLMGLGNGWITHSTWLAFKAMGGFAKRLKLFVGSIYRGYWARQADRWVVEASNSRAGMIRRLHVNPDAVAVVPNSCAALFAEAGVADAKFPEPGAEISLLYLSAWYGHKNIQSIPRVAFELKRLAPERQFRFVITVPQDEPALAGLYANADALGVRDSIDNRGHVPLARAVDLYAEADICFMPSLLETFSANYPEAMSTGRPLVASDLDFAHAICGDAAVYFEATDPEAAARAVLDLVSDAELWQQLIRRGRRQVAELPSTAGKYERYEQLIRETVT